MTTQKGEREEALEAAMDEAKLAALRIIAIDEGEPGSDDEVEYLDSVAVARAFLSSSKAEGEMREINRQLVRELHDVNEMALAWRGALEGIRYHSENQDMSHLDFRIKARESADAALTPKKDGK